MGGAKIVSIAPARICLFGDHQDYLGLPVIAAAINRSIRLEATPNNNNTFNIQMPDVGKKRTININDTFEVLEKRDYFGSSLRVLKRYGCIPSQGYDVAISGDITINAGISSSSAVSISWINFLIQAFGINQSLTPKLLSYIAYETEVLEHKEPGGNMDQYSISHGDIVFLETTGDFSCTKIGQQMDGLILSESGMAKNTLGLLSKVRSATLEAINRVQNAFPDFCLKDAKIDDIKKYTSVLSETLLPYFEAAIENHHYTQEALKECKKETLSLKKIGALMNNHHSVLKEKLRVTIPIIDKMVDVALASGAYGTKIVGSGGGGNIVIIAPPHKKQEIIKKIQKDLGKNTYSIAVSQGAHIEHEKE